MRTQKEIAVTIIEQGADYVPQVKDTNDARRPGGLQGTQSAPQAKAPLQEAGTTGAQSVETSYFIHSEQG